MNKVFPTAPRLQDLGTDTSPLLKPRTLIATWRDALRTWWTATQRPRVRSLRELDDHTLRDIGLTRGEIASVEAELSGRAARTRRRGVDGGWCGVKRRADDGPGA